MELQTVTLDRNAARKAFLEYRAAVRERHDEEDAQIMRGYRALAQGHQLIRLSETLRAGGSEVKQIKHGDWREGRHVTWAYNMTLPRLAVTRADAKVCYTQGIDSQGRVVFTADRTERELADSNKRDRFRTSPDMFEHNGTFWDVFFRAIVPNVPPPLRPAHKLSGYMILWEAEWAQHPAPPAPRDPALLKHVGGDLYAVVAIWDLTELERAVLAARA